jgi:outer membrane receptor protein involved in Fe transport
MKTRTTLAASALVLALSNGGGATAQVPAAAPAAERMGDGSSLPTSTAEGEGTPTPEPTHTPATPKTKKHRPPTESRGPTLMQLEEVVVEADRPLSAASSKLIRTRDFALRPHSTTQEILNNVPGLVVVQHQGGGKAVQYLLRGFDADHGTDFALFTDGIPVNLVSHAHGQGYADLNYLIPETVKDLELYKGPYFVEFGDFATAGALEIATKDEYAENFALAEGGFFDTQRYVLGGSPKVDWAKTLLAAEAYFTNGPFENPQNYARYNVFGKLTLAPTTEHRLTTLASFYYGDWDGSGQIPVRAVGNGPGQISRFGSLDPSEGGTTDRENVSLAYRYTPDSSTTWDAQLWGSHYDLKLFSDFTLFRDTGLRFIGLANGGFVDTCAAGFSPSTGTCGPIDPSANYIPGDEIEQRDHDRFFFGGHVAYTKYWTLIPLPVVGAVPTQTQFALQTRRDQTDVSLFRDVRRHPFYDVNRVGIGEQSVSGLWGQQFFFTEWARLEAGVRGDVFFFDVTNRLPQQGPDRNFVPVPISGTDVSGLASPKVNLVLGPWHQTDLYLNYGNGFHSNDARAVVLTGQSGLVPANGYEIGSRTRQFNRLDAAAALWLIDLKNELVFSGDSGNVDAQVNPVTGNFVPTGPSRRWGIDFETRYQFTSWLFADYDMTYADPRFKDGGAIPLAPTLLINSGITAEFPNGFAAALRLRHLGRRPANEDRTLHAQGWTLLDLVTRYRWRNVELSLSFLNLANAEWREAQFADATCLRGEESGGYPSQPCPVTGSLPTFKNPNPPPTTGFVAEGLDGITFTPGNPFNVRGGLQIFF